MQLKVLRVLSNVIPAYLMHVMPIFVFLILTKLVAAEHLHEEPIYKISGKCSR